MNNNNNAMNKGSERESEKMATTEAMAVVAAPARTKCVLLIIAISLVARIPTHAYMPFTHHRVCSSNGMCNVE